MHAAANKRPICRVMIACVMAFVPAMACGQPVPSGAREEALAGATMAEAFDASSMYLNPAILGFLPRTSLSLTYLQNTGGTPAAGRLAFPVPLGHELAFAFGGGVSHVFPPTAGMPVGGGPLTATADAGVAVDVASTVSLGVLLQTEDNGGATSGRFAASASVGLLYSPSPDISYGLTAGGFGTGFAYEQVGMSGQVMREKLPRTLEIGAAMRFPSASTLQKPIVAIALSNEKIFTERGLIYKGGLEVLPVEALALRIGYLYGPGISAPRYGLGLEVSPVRVDYCYAPDQLPLVPPHSITLSVDF